jgi:hypothetical protein
VGPADVEMAPLVGQSLRRHLRHPLTSITYVAPASLAGELSKRVQDPVMADEDLLELATIALARELYGPRAGWMLQQLVKLSSPELVRGDFAMVIDADTVLVQPRTFCDGRRSLLLASREYHLPYYRALHGLTGLTASTPKVSFVGHHLWLELDALGLLRDQIEARCSQSWTEAILRTAHQESPGQGAPFSEYELYGQWQVATNPGSTVVRPLRNQAMARPDGLTLEELERTAGRGVYSVSLHHYLGRR